MTTQPENQPTSFSRALIVNIIGLYLVLEIGFLTVMAWQAAASTREASGREIAETLDRTTTRIGSVIQAAEMTAGSMERVVRGGPVDGGSLRPSLDRLLSAFEQHRHLSFIGISIAATGEYGLLERKADGTVLLVLYPPGGSTDSDIQTYLTTDRGLDPDQTYPNNGYDVRKRPFYRAAIEAPSSGGWVPIFQWIDYTKSYPALWGFSFVKALRDGNGDLLGVIDTDFDMPALNRLVEAVSAENGSQVEILQLGPAPRLIAGPGLTAVPKQPPTELLRLAQETRPGPEASPDFIGKMKLHGRPKWVATRRIPIEGGITWLVVVSRPVDIIEPPLRRQLFHVGLTGLVVAAGMGLLSLRIGRRLGQPLADLGSYVSHIGKHDPDLRESRIPSSAHDFEETSRLGLALDQMLVERTELQQQLAQRQRLEALGQLTGGIAHDFNNLLTIIIGSSEDLVEGLRDEDQLELASVILSTSERAAELTGRMLSFARKQPLTPRLVHVDALINNLLPLLHRSVPGGIEIRHLVSSEPHVVYADRGQLEIALLNLVINARDAMAGQGLIEIGVEDVETEESPPSHAELRPGRYAAVYVADDGAGMSAETIKQAFDPFFTTKEAGTGTGLGLSMVYGFAKQSGGDAEISSTLGEGTTVKLYLPASGEDVEAHATLGGSAPTA